MARKNYPDEFKRDAVALYQDTEGSTITVIAAELGVSEATLSAWCKVAGVPIRHRKPGPDSVPAPSVETAEQELARLRAPGQGLAGGQDEVGHRAGHSAVGGEIFRRGDELVSRFQFVADHLHAFEVKWLCAIVEVARSSFYAWLAGADGRAALEPLTRYWPSGSARCTPRTTPTGRRGSPPSSTTVCPRVSGSTTSGWPG